MIIVHGLKQSLPKIQMNSIRDVQKITLLVILLSNETYCKMKVQYANVQSRKLWQIVSFQKQRERRDGSHVELANPKSKHICSKSSVVDGLLGWWGAYFTVLQDHENTINISTLKGSEIITLVVLRCSTRIGLLANYRNSVLINFWITCIN